MKLFQIASEARKKIMLTTKPKEGYFLATKSVEPISSHFGFDRGTPIDRFWIDGFILENKDKISGHVLEIDDARYAAKFSSKITTLDILDINPKNKKANIHGDLRNLNGKIPDNTYDCIILTHVLGMIDDVPAAVSEIRRILKPGGTLLATSASLSPTYDEKYSFWRFTKASFEYLFKDGFVAQVKTYGNVLTGQCFWVGLSQEELSKEELEFNDSRYPCVVSVVATKKD